MVSAQRWQGLLPSIEVAPNMVSALAQRDLGAAIRRHLPVEVPQTLADDNTPDIYVGAADVRSGAFTVFGGRSPPSIEQVLASAAVPELFPAVRVGERYFWDGLLSQNPPVRDFLRGRKAADIPDEIWIVRINPVNCPIVPSQLNDIRDRRNEMAGNLALAEEVYFIERVNKWVAGGLLPGKKHIAVREIAADGLNERRFDYASKLDRAPAFIEALLEQGRAAAAAFLDA
jgi:NTE family protein